MIKNMISNDIRQYSSWFDNKIDFIATVKDDDIKILACCSLIDALAKCVYCDKSNRERFINVLEQFGDSKIWSKVSIYHLTSDKGYNVFRAITRINNYFEQILSDLIKQDGKIVGCNIDTTICYIEKTINDFESIKGLKEICQYYKYSSIFYREYRCGLVHEARIISKFNFDYCRSEEPYYANYITENNSHEKHLIIPVSFVINTTKIINSNVRNWLIKQNINPYERYSII